MRHFQSEALISARPATIWNVITDGGNFGVWDSGILEADGVIRDGDTVRVTTPRKPRGIKLRVQQRDAQVMTWKRALPLGLWKRTRIFTLTPGPGATRLRVVEHHSGFLLPLDKHSKTDPFLDPFVQAVRSRAELLDRLP